MTPATQSTFFLLLNYSATITVIQSPLTVCVKNNSKGTRIKKNLNNYLRNALRKKNNNLFKVELENPSKKLILNDTRFLYTQDNVLKIYFLKKKRTKDNSNN